MVIVQFRGHLVQQYRACVVDSLGLGITCVSYHCTCTRHPSLVSFAFYAIPIFYVLIFTFTSCTLQHNYKCVCTMYMYM